jgi:signal peptide peptidase SppA
MAATTVIGDPMSFARLLGRISGGRWGDRPPLVTVVRLTGVIGSIGPLRRGLTLTGLAATLERAFGARGVKAVALAINSPGGSAVQSALIARRIRALAEEKSLPVLAFAEDVAASGGYWLATAADEIFADESSVVGSIGVLSGGFGFPDAMRRLGVERRLRTAGEYKASLDPFQPEKPEHLAHLQTFLDDVHESFRAQVRGRRGDRLTAPEDEVFSGRWWSGRTALALGLIDGIGDLRTVLRARYGDDVQLRLVGDRQPWWRRRLALAETAAPTLDHLPGAAIAAVEERLMWNRFGL